MGGTDVARNISLQNVGLTGSCADLKVDNIGLTNRLDISTSLDAQAKATIVWDVPFGTPGSPVSFAGDPYIMFLAGQDGGSLTDATKFTFEICSRLGGCATTTVNLVGNTGGSYVQLYASLIGIGLSQVQLADISRVTLTVEGGPAYDIKVDEIMTGVPEPATMALFGSGLIGLGLYRRKR